MTWFFLDGLGSNRYYSQDLLTALATTGLEVTYLALPGHPGYEGPPVKDPASFLAWLDQALPPEAVSLMGFSLGADLAAAYALARPERVSQLVLLDGGVWDISQMDVAAELAGAEAYLESQRFLDMAEHLNQVRSESKVWTGQLEQAEKLAYTYDEDLKAYVLNLQKAQILDLLRLRSNLGSSLKDNRYQTPTLALLSDSPKEALEQKQAYLASLPQGLVSHLVLADSDHSLCQTAVDRLVPLLTAGLSQLANQRSS